MGLVQRKVDFNNFLVIFLQEYILLIVVFLDFEIREIVVGFSG
jgi:hypothetical protein